LFYNGWHPVLPWVGFFFIGMWAGKLKLGTRRVQVSLALGGAAVAILAAVASGWLGQDHQLAEIVAMSPIPPGPIYLIAASGSAFAAIGLILLSYSWLDQARIAPWLAAPGRMALTLYIAHIFVGMGILQGLGLLDGSLGNGAILAIAAVFCASCVLFARLWFSKLHRGPLEAVMRRMTKE